MTEKNPTSQEPTESTPTVESIDDLDSHLADQPVPKPVKTVGQLVRSGHQLLIAAVVLLAVLTLGSLTALVNMVGQMYDLQAQVTGMSVQLDRTVEAVENAPVAAAPAPSAAPSPDPSAPLTDAKELTGVDLPEGMDATGAVLLGSPEASMVVESFLDFQCPFCQRWEQSFGAQLSANALKEGSDLLMKVYPMAFLGETSPDLNPAGPSGRAANAALCVLDQAGPEGYAKMADSIFMKADPAEPPTQFQNEQLIKWAKEAGAPASVSSCIEDGTFLPAVAALTQGAFGRGVNGTPTVVINGQRLANPGADPLLDEAMAKGQ